MPKRKIYPLTAETYNKRFYNNTLFMKSFSLKNALSGNKKKKIYRVPSGLYIYQK